jgi:hypothetical protein
VQTELALGPVALDPRAAGALAHSGRLGGLRDRPPLLDDRQHHPTPSLQTERRVSVKLHPVSSFGTDRLAALSLQGGPDVSPHRPNKVSGTTPRQRRHQREPSLPHDTGTQAPRHCPSANRGMSGAVLGVTPASWLRLRGGRQGVIRAARSWCPICGQEDTHGRIGVALALDFPRGAVLSAEHRVVERDRENQPVEVRGGEQRVVKP